MTDLKASLDDISLLSVMLDPSDPSSISIALETIEDFGKLLGGQSETLKMEKDIATLIQSKGILDASIMIDKIHAFISEAQALLDNPNRANQQDNVTNNWDGDLSTTLDRELVTEFIEKHSSLLEEFEAQTIEQLNSDAETFEEFLAAAKSYLHNIKGDAGSVGLLGVQVATHAMEDRLIEDRSRASLERLLHYKEWLALVIKAYINGTIPQVLAPQFINQINGAKAAPPSKAQEHVQSDQALTTSDHASHAFVPERYQLSGDMEILNDFLVEAEDHLAISEELLLSKESNYSSDDIQAIFRAVHSIKGGSSYFSLSETTRSSHDVENLLDLARNGRIHFNQALKRIILSYIDLQRTLLRRTRVALKGDGYLETNEETARFINNVSDLLNSTAQIKELEGLFNQGNDRSASDVKAVILNQKVELPTKAAKETTHTAEAPKVEASEVQSVQATKDSLKGSEKISTNQDKDADTGEKKGEALAVKEFVKVDTARLDELLEYIGEMVISSSMLIKSCRDKLPADEQVISNTDQLERISREIQQLGMSMRLVPIKGLFQKMSRVVWDTAKKLSKDIRFDMDGADTELDRSVIDGLADPLMHMVRNSVDHGIESAAERSAAGKNPQGTVKLSAYHSAGSIIIKVSDDGKGLNPQVLIDKAKKSGLVGENQTLSDEEAYMLIFAAGFSTAKVVTDVSGRGVGMDVVRRNIEKMRGRVRIESALGKGTTFYIELPLTLAIMEGVETSVGEESFIIPALSIVEFLKPTPDMIMHTLDRGETLKFRGNFLPIFRFTDIYGVKHASQSISEGILLIVESHGQQVALLVDSVMGKLSAVIKGLGTLFQNVRGLSGCAIMPNGSIGLIIDVPTLVALAQDSPGTQSRLLGKLPDKENLGNALRSGVPIQ